MGNQLRKIFEHFFNLNVIAKVLKFSSILQYIYAHILVKYKWYFLHSFMLTLYTPFKKNLVHCQVIINNWKFSVDTFRSQKIPLPVNAAPWNFYCSWRTRPTTCMSNFIKIHWWEVGFLSFFSSKTEKIRIFEKNIPCGVNFITALNWKNSHFQKHQILSMAFY